MFNPELNKPRFLKRFKPMMQVKTLTKIIPVTLALAATLFAGFAVADGTHGVSVKVVNNSNKTIEVQTYNGMDSAQIVPHKVYYICQAQDL